MAEEQIMNTGWHPWRDYSYPQATNSSPMWDDLLNQSFIQLFNFGWLGRQTYLRHSHFPAIRRQRGMTDFGGIYEYAVLGFDPELVEQQAAQAEQDRLQLAIDNAAAPSEPHAFNLVVHSGRFSSESMHWVEMFNPLTFKREHFSPKELDEFSTKLVDRAGKATLRVRSAFPQAAKQWEDRVRQQRKWVVMTEQISSALLLASLFAQKRIPFDSLLELMVALPGYAWVYPCVKDFPAGTSVEEVGMQRLLTLYGFTP